MSPQQDKKSEGFTDEERAAMKARAQELKAEARMNKDKAEGENAVLAAIAAMQEPDRAMAERLHQSQRASPLVENLVRDARVCQGWQGRLFLPKRTEVQHEVCDVRLQRHGKPRRRRPVAGCLRAEEVDCRRRGKDQRAREESGELRTYMTSPKFTDSATDYADCG
jgi:hypothetical protein